MPVNLEIVRISKTAQGKMSTINPAIVGIVVCNFPLSSEEVKAHIEYKHDTGINPKHEDLEIHVLLYPLAELETAREVMKLLK